MSMLYSQLVTIAAKWQNKSIIAGLNKKKNKCEYWFLGGVTCWK